MYPQLGAANTPYARSVLPKVTQLGALPDPGVIFDSIFARDKFTPHPNNVSSVLFYWASIIIHGTLPVSCVILGVRRPQMPSQIFSRRTIVTSACLRRPRILTFPRSTAIPRKIKTQFGRLTTARSSPIALLSNVCWDFRLVVV